LAAFYLLSVFIGGLANILAFGLMQMDGLSGIRAWQWIFIIEGLLTMLVAITARFIIIDFPDKSEKTGFLTGEQAEFVKQRIQNDRGDALPDKLTWPIFFHHLSDLKLWAL
jgi:MFS family permease